jgi:hypothetical protein
MLERDKGILKLESPDAKTDPKSVDVEYEVKN